MRTLGWSFAGGLLLVVGVVAVAGSALGCSSSDDDSGSANGGAGATGAGAGPGAGGSGETCGAATFIPADCQSCLEGGCCDELAACDDDCLDWFACANDCVSEPGCKADCDQAVPAGAAAAADLGACVTGSCETECGGGMPNPNAICDSGFSLADDTECATCLGESCCDTYKDCAADATCYDCLTGEDATACDDTTLDEAVGDCTFQTCDAVCE